MTMGDEKMRILIYGAGVIGSLYAALLADQNSISVYARGNRLKELLEHGLRYYDKTGAVKTADVKVISRLEDDDIYDYIFVTVRKDQLYAALEELKNNHSPAIVTMVNSLDSYDKWEELCDRGRIIPAFPGAGGGFRDGILDAGLTPGFIQPTTFAEISGIRTKRVSDLEIIFKTAGIPCQIVPDMHAWQICHLAMVVPLADAYYEAKDPERAGHDHRLMKKTALRIKDNMNAVRRKGIVLSPTKMDLFRLLPASILAAGLSIAYRSSFGDRFMYQHSKKAPDEMRALHEQFYSFIHGNHV